MCVSIGDSVVVLHGPLPVLMLISTKRNGRHRVYASSSADAEDGVLLMLLLLSCCVRCLFVGSQQQQGGRSIDDV